MTFVDLFDSIWQCMTMQYIGISNGFWPGKHVCVVATGKSVKILSESSECHRIGHGSYDAFCTFQAEMPVDECFTRVLVAIASRRRLPVSKPWTPQNDMRLHHFPSRSVIIDDNLIIAFNYSIQYTVYRCICIIVLVFEHFKMTCITYSFWAARNMHILVCEYWNCCFLLGPATLGAKSWMTTSDVSCPTRTGPYW